MGENYSKPLDYNPNSNPLCDELLNRISEGTGLSKEEISKMDEVEFKKAMRGLGIKPPRIERVGNFLKTPSEKEMRKRDRVLKRILEKYGLTNNPLYRLVSG